MKTFFPIKHQIFGAMLKMLFVSLLFWACTNDADVTPVRPDSFSDPLSARESNDARKSFSPEDPRYNLNVFFHEESRKTFGFLRFRQFENETQLIHLYTWVHGLEPNTSYVLQRAVDTTLDGNCTGVAWLSLGDGMVPKSIVTDNLGSGYAELWRSVAAIPVGTVFDIHFQIVNQSTSAVAFASDCYQYKVH